jgi:hypothetical protein
MSQKDIKVLVRPKQATALNSELALNWPKSDQEFLQRSRISNLGNDRVRVRLRFRVEVLGLVLSSLKCPQLSQQVDLGLSRWSIVMGWRPAKSSVCLLLHYGRDWLDLGLETVFPVVFDVVVRGLVTISGVVAVGRVHKDKTNE